MKPEFRNDFRLFWISVILLFLELLIIRWLSAELRIFAYFHNLVLIICFLGIGLGCAQTDRKTSILIPLAILTALVFLIYCPVNLGALSIRKITNYLGNLKDFVIWYQSVSPGSKKTWEIFLGVGMLATLTVGIVYLFVPFGQLLGRLLDESQKPIRAYTINIIGSLVGILLYTLLAFLSTPPPVWFGLFFISILILLFIEEKRILVLPSAIFMIVTMGLLIFTGSLNPRDREKEIIWSPYQKLEVAPLDKWEGARRVRVGYIINVNSVPYQQAIDLSENFVAANPRIYGFHSLDLLKFDHYNLPFLFSEELNKVLIVGAGSGNDAAGALRNGVKRVDAVEIDPRIIDLGKRLHPERPYDSEHVNLINDDARSFFHRADKDYDLVVFGLLDSHTLSSNLSNVRLDNFVYTLESLQEAKSLIKPDGALVLTFDVRDKFIGQSLFAIMTQAFGKQPLCFNLQDSVRGWGGNVFVGGSEAALSRAIIKHPFLLKLLDRSFAIADAPEKIPTDDWPYLYLSGPGIPSLYYIIFGLLIIISLTLVRRDFHGLKDMDWHFFFLGAGFLLIEVQNVSKLALLFGSTWVVNSIIISGIMIMILLANYYVLKIEIKSHLPYYAGLAISLVIIYFFPLGQLAGLPFLTKALIAGLVLSAPIFFAGIIFAHSFRNAQSLNKVFASNLIGAMVGGMLECASFIVGIRALLALALLLYALSFITIGKPKTPQ